MGGAVAALLWTMDLIAEAAYAAILVGAFVLLLVSGRREKMAGRPGWYGILVGLSILALAATLDFFDDFIVEFWVVAGIDFEEILEHVVFPLSGIGLLMYGVIRWAPLHARLESARDELHASEIARLRDVDQFKTTFLNTAAHELATPLTPVMMQVEMLEDQAKEKGGDLEAMRLLRRNVERLQRLVDDLLDATRMQSGTLKTFPKDLALDGLIKEAGAGFSAICEDAKVRFSVAADPGLRVNADPDRVLQILYNLVSNAIKFTPSGGQVELRVYLQGSEVAMQVKDTGAGLDQDQLKDLFKPFVQHHRKLVGPHVGTGLGLFIAQGIAESHGGRIEAASEGPDKGATFTFWLPALQDDATNEAAA